MFTTPRVVFAWATALLLAATLVACSGDDQLDPRACANLRAAIAAYELILADGGTLNDTDMARLAALRLFVEANCVAVPPPPAVPAMLTQER